MENSVRLFVENLTDNIQKTPVVATSFKTIMDSISDPSEMTKNKLLNIQDEINKISAATNISSEELKNMFGVAEEFDIERRFSNFTEAIHEATPNTDEWEEFQKTIDGFATSDMELMMNGVEDATKGASTALKEYTKNAVEAAIATGDTQYTLQDVLDSEGRYNAVEATQGNDFIDKGDVALKMQEYLSRGIELLNKGQSGTEEFKSIAKMFDPYGSDSAERFAENYDKYVKLFGKYDTENNAPADMGDAVDNFLSTLEKTDNPLNGKKMAEYNDETQEWALNLGDAATAADTLGLSLEGYMSLLDLLQSYDFEIETFDTEEEGYARLSELQGDLYEKQKELHQLEAEPVETRDEDAIKAKKEEIEELKESIRNAQTALQQLLDYEDVNPEKQEQAYVGAFSTASTEANELYDKYGNPNNKYYQFGQSRLIGLAESTQQAVNEYRVKINPEIEGDALDEIEALNEVLEKAGLGEYTIDISSEIETPTQEETGDTSVDSMNITANTVALTTGLLKSAADKTNNKTKTSKETIEKRRKQAAQTSTTPRDTLRQRQLAESGAGLSEKPTVKDKIKNFFTSNPKQTATKSNAELGKENLHVDTFSSILSSFKDEVNKASKYEAKTKYGNVNLTDRQGITWNDQTLQRYSAELKSQGLTPEKGSISTVLGSWATYTDEQIPIAFSPMLQTDHGAELLSASTMDKYISDLISKASADGEWTNEELLSLDAEGMEVDGKQIKNMIADIGETAEETSHAMHYMGNTGQLQMSFDDLVTSAADAGISLQDLMKEIDVIPPTIDTSILAEFYGVDALNHLEELEATAVSVDENGDIVIETSASTEDAQAKIEELGIEGATVDGQTITVHVGATDGVTPVVNQASASIQSMPDGEVPINGDNSDAIAKANETQNKVDSLTGKTIKIVASTIGLGPLISLKNTISNLKDKSITIWTHKKTSNDGTVRYAGTAHAFGTARLMRRSGRAYATGNWGLRTNEKHALVGELGEEMYVDPNTGMYQTIGTNGAEFVDLPKGAIVFNHRQTEEIFKYGHISTRGKALVTGNASSGPAHGGSAGSGKRAKSGSSSSSSSSSNSSSTNKNTSATNKNTEAKNNNTDTTKKNTKSAEDLKEEFDKLHDWIEVWIDRVNSKIDQWETKADSDIMKWSKQNNLLEKVMRTSRGAAKRADASYARYKEQANAVGLKEKYKKLVRQGDYDAIEKLTVKSEGKSKGDLNEKLKEQIEEYQTWYEKALEVKNQQIEWQQKIVDAEQQQLDNIRDSYDAIVSLYESYESVAAARQASWDARGKDISSKQYKSDMNTQVKYQRKQTNALHQELLKTHKELKEAKSVFGANSDQYKKAVADYNSIRADYYDSIAAAAELKDA
ncbi:MAG: hypothetical protein K6A73_00835, partial [Bacteroidales bacterium]|nr:hypothetical protein [Bacteroidales bacterium]